MSTWRDAVAYLVLVVSIAGPTDAAPASSRAMDVDNITPTVRGVAAAAAHARAVGCRAPLCRAMEAIDEVVKIEAFEEDNVEMGNSRILYSEPAVWRWRRRALLDQPDLYAAFCATGVKLLARVSPRLDTVQVSVPLLVAGVDVDLRSHLHCARDLAGALPQSSAADKLRVWAYNECEHDWHPRPRAACDTLVEGLPAAELR